MLFIRVVAFSVLFRSQKVSANRSNTHSAQALRSGSVAEQECASRRIFLRHSCMCGNARRGFRALVRPRGDRPTRRVAAHPARARALHRGARGDAVSTPTASQAGSSRARARGARGSSRLPRRPPPAAALQQSSRLFSGGRREHPAARPPPFWNFCREFLRSFPNRRRYNNRILDRGAGAGC